MSEDLRQTTIDTYNHSALELTEYFKGIGPREKDIDIAFELAGNPAAPNVLEIGCGDGRDAQVITRRTPNYLGIDISEEMINIARDRVQAGWFKVADAATYDFPPNLDIVFAFASLLHLNKPELHTVFNGLARALRPNGIVYISSKYSPEYTEEIKEDEFGRRLFYFYNAENMSEIAGPTYKMIKTWQEVHGNTDWFELVLQKQQLKI